MGFHGYLSCSYPAVELNYCILWLRFWFIGVGIAACWDSFVAKGGWVSVFVGIILMVGNV